MRCKSAIFYLCFAVGLTFSSPKGLSGWDPVSYFHDKFDRDGVLNLAVDLDRVDVGQSESLPVCLLFSADRHFPSPTLGEGWMMPLLSAYLVQRDSEKFTAMLPNGQLLDLARGKKPEELHSAGGDWSGLLSQEFTRITNKEGWSILYKSGCINKIVTPKGVEIDVRTISDSEQSILVGGRELLNLKKDPQGNVRMLAGSNRISIEMGSRPIVSSQGGVNVVSSVSLAPVSLHRNGGKFLDLKYELNEANEPVLEVAGQDSIKGRYVWSPAGGKLLSHNEDRYEFQTLEGGQKQFKTTGSDQRAEVFEFNPYTLSSKQVGRDGSVVEYSTFASGKLNGVPRKGIMTRDGASERIFFLRVDEVGNPLEEIRRVDGKEQVTKYAYGEGAKLLSKEISLGGELLSKEEFSSDGARKLILPEAVLSFEKDEVVISPQKSKYQNKEKSNNEK